MKKIENHWIGQPDYHCFGCDPSHEHGLKMEFYEDGEDVVSIWQPTGEYQGWPNILHGGIQATLIDELCGWTIGHKYKSDAVTSKMEIRYRTPVKINEGNLQYALELLRFAEILSQSRLRYLMRAKNFVQKVLVSSICSLIFQNKKRSPFGDLFSFIL